MSHSFLQTVDLKNKDDFKKVVGNFESLSEMITKNLPPIINHFIPFFGYADKMVYVCTIQGKKHYFEVARNAMTLAGSVRLEDDEVDGIINDNFEAIARNLSSPKMVSKVFHFVTGELLQTNKLYNDKGPYVTVETA